jgi:hypothetical protein
LLASPRGILANNSPYNQQASSIDSKETRELNKDLPMQGLSMPSYRAKILKDHKRSVFTPQQITNHSKQLTSALSQPI